MLSSRFALILLAASLLAAEAAEYRDEYDLINDYLVENVKDAKDSDDYLDKAEEWLNSMSLFSQVGARLRRGPDAKVAPALKQLVALRNLRECNYREYEILRRNGAATDGQGRRPGSSRPIDQIVYAQSLAHATHCKSSYPVDYVFSRHSLDEDLAKRVEGLHKYYLRNVTYAAAFDGGEWSANKATDVYDFLQSLKDTRVYTDILDVAIEPIDVGKAIVTLAKQFPKAILLNSVLSDNFQSAEFYSLLLLPCDHYINRMDLFIAAQYDDELLQASGDTQQVEVDDQLFDYHLGWSKFNLCRRIMDNQSELRKYWLDNWRSIEAQAAGSESSPAPPVDADA